MDREDAKAQLWQQALDLVLKHGTYEQASRASGISKTTLYDRAKMGRSAGLMPHAEQAPVGAVLTQPRLPSAAMSDEELLDGLEIAYRRTHREHAARRWHEIAVNSDAPMGIVWFGDPHMDDGGCDWPQLRYDVAVTAKTPGMVGANIGDSTNNWLGKLLHLYEEQLVTRTQAAQLVEWLLHRSGVEWLMWLLGNHDAWRGGSELMRAQARNIVPLHDWQAQIKLTFPCGLKLPIWAAHDFKGSSAINPLQGPMKMAERAQAALYICGHRHNYAMFHSEHPFQGGQFWACRAKGYKAIDSYAEKGQFGHQITGASIVSVIDPLARGGAGYVHCFPDVEEGADYLLWRRKRAGFCDET